MRRALALAVLAILVPLLTACAGPVGPGSLADDTYPGFPNTSDPGGDDMTFDTSPQATWIETGRSIAITTWGSSSCPPVPTVIEATADDAVTVHFESSPRDPCTADMAVTTHELTLPDEAVTVPPTITLAYSSSNDTTVIVLG